ncbi:PDZ domain-containing protein [Geomicrobium sp. JCM 19037]|uniref:PDZ domain-containing protein n=1 Tax=Geomicrobium sp. JCM 19037 TaxID=1460634 RepID=UPI0005A626DC|nr:PDZ domain-containing protein [Geomicrobium sp. JCM 19037]
MLSSVVLLLGLVFAPAYILMAAMLYALLLIVFGARFLSAAYALLIAYLLDVGFAFFNVELPFVQVGQAEAFPVLVLVGLLLIVEAILLIRLKKPTHFSPLRTKSKRGKWIGGQMVERAWLIPIFIFIPGSGFSDIGWWPVFSFGNEVSLVLLPILIGHRARSQTELLYKQIQRTAIRTLWLAVLASVGATIVYFDVFSSLVTVSVLFAFVVFVHILRASREGRQIPYFTPRSDGVMILAVITDSPADKMGLKPGEIITKVHQEPVNSEWSFYQKLQINPAYGRVEVVDAQGEKRIEQAALYDNQHHELGIIFLKPESREEWHSYDSHG